MTLSPECALLIFEGVTRILNLSKGRWQILFFFNLKFDCENCGNLKAELFFRQVFSYLESTVFSRPSRANCFLHEVLLPTVSLCNNKPGLTKLYLKIVKFQSEFGGITKKLFHLLYL